MTIDLWSVTEARERLGAMKHSLPSTASVLALCTFFPVWALAQTAEVAPAAQDASSAVPPDPKKPATVAAFVNVGFSHWFGETFGAPAGMTTPALVVGVRPGLEFLELRAHYTLSVLRHELPSNGERSLVGFANLDVLLSRELRVAGERMMVQCGPSAGFVHTNEGLGLAYGVVFATRYLIDMGEHFALGPFFDVRWQSYDLPGSPNSDAKDEGLLNAGRTDAQSQVGVALAFW